MPIDNPPQDPIEGQVAIGSDGSFNWFANGAWQSVDGTPSLVGNVPQDVVEGQIALGSDGSFHWYTDGVWYTAPWIPSQGTNFPQDAIMGQIATSTVDSSFHWLTEETQSYVPPPPPVGWQYLVENMPPWLPYNTGALGPFAPASPISLFVPITNSAVPNHVSLHELNDTLSNFGDWISAKVFDPTVSFPAFVNRIGVPGLTWDYDGNRLIHAHIPAADLTGFGGFNFELESSIDWISGGETGYVSGNLDLYHDLTGDPVPAIGNLFEVFIVCSHQASGGIGLAPQALASTIFKFGTAGSAYQGLDAAMHILWTYTAPNIRVDFTAR